MNYLFRELKNAKLFVIALITRKILSSGEFLHKKFCTRNQFLFCKKICFPNYRFLSAWAKRLTQHICKVSADEGIGK